MRHLDPIFLSAMLLGLAGCQSRPETLFQQAQRALASDDAERAARLFKEITIAAPDEPLAARAHYELAQMYYLRLRDVNAARDGLLRVLTEYPESPVALSARRLLARLYERELDAPEKALAQYEVLMQGPLDADSEREMLLAIADCRYRLDELEASAEAYRKVLALPYEDVTDSAYLRLATIEWIEGSPDESLRLLRALREKSASDERRYEAAVGEIELLTRLDRFADARRQLEEARAAFPDRSDLDDLRSWMQTAYRQQQSLDADGAALEELQKTIRWGSGRPRRSTPRPRDPS